MKNIFIVFLLSLVFNTFAQTNEQLFKVIENDRFGFINAEGEVVIPIKYRSAGEFSEGLCPVRLNGTYGFINTKNEFIIAAQFDYARSFSEGMALVYIDGQSFFINKKGEKAFDCNFKKVENLKNGRVKIKTQTVMVNNRYEKHKEGFYNEKGELFIDTIYSMIGEFNDGLAIVESEFYHPRDDSLKNFDIGVIDTLGNMIIPYGKYKYISPFRNGRAYVTLFNQTKEDKTSFFINKKGELGVQEKIKGKWLPSKFNDGVAVIDLCRKRANKNVYSSKDSYDGLINSNGDTIIGELIYRNIDKFKDGRSFARDENRDYFVIDTKGKKKRQLPLSNKLDVGFQNGLAIVNKDWEKWGIIDTSGAFILSPRYHLIHRVGIIDNYFFFGIYDESTKREYDKLFGIATIHGDTILPPVMRDFSKKGFQNGLLTCVIDKKFTYINKKGQIIWEEQKMLKKEITHLNIDYMNRGYFYASSVSHVGDLGGFGRSNNQAYTISDSSFSENQLHLLVSEKIDTIKGKYKDLFVFLVNTTKNAILFNAQDSRLNMKVQALDKFGIWRDIEYLPRSWCGNSYHTLTLESGEYWRFSTPIYQGDFKTKFRIAVKYINPNDVKKLEEEEEELFLADEELKEITIYSNEYEGSINPAQFWRKAGYYSNNIMNPYND